MITNNQPTLFKIDNIPKNTIFDEILLNDENLLILQFHQLLQDKLFLSNIQSCNSKDELNYYIKPKDKLEALHDKFIRYGTKKATSFLIIDIDNIKTPFEEYCKEVEYKLKDIKPNWILKTDKGYHIGFILDNPIWLNNKDQVKIAQEIKKDLTIILDGDISGSHRLIGYWRNPLTHQSKLSLELHNLETLQKKAFTQYLESFSLFEDDKTAQDKINKKQKDIYQIAKSNWEQIDKKGFVKGNRNNFLFNKVIGMLYNGLIANNEVLTTLETLNNNELDTKEIQKIAKSILKYDIKPIKKPKTEKERKRLYAKELAENKIHNYKEKNKIVFARQQIGQKISTAKIIQKTIKKLITGYMKTYQNQERFINRILEKNSNVDKRTIQRYRNDRKIEEAIKSKAFIEYIKSLAPQGVMPNDTPINEIINIVLENLEYYYPKTEKTFKFKINSQDRLIFYDTSQSNELLAA